MSDKYNFIKISEIIETKSSIEIINILDKIREQIFKKGLYSDKIKNNLIQNAKILRNKNKSIWDKNVAKKFGSLLKYIILLMKIEELHEKENKEEKYDTLYKYCGYSNIKKIFSNINIINVSIDTKHVCVISDHGQVFTVGNASFGRLGHGNKEDLKYFKKIENIDKCKWSSTGYAFTLLVTIQGEIYCFGCSDNGRLGLENDERNVLSPKKISIDWTAEKTFCGSTISVAISKDKNIYSCGDKYYNGNFGKEDSYEFKKIEKLNDILFRDCSIGPGGYHCLALSLSNCLYTWGHNRVGQLGKIDIEKTINLNISDYIIPYPILVKDNLVYKISTGWGHSSYIDFKKNVYLCGRNVLGQVGINPEICKKNNCGYEYVDEFQSPKELENINIKDISCGGSNTGILSEENIIYIFGCNNYKYLPNELRSYSYKPFKIDKFKDSKNIKIFLGTDYFLILEKK